MTGPGPFPMRPSADVDWSAAAERYADLVYSVAIKFRLSSHDAEDMFQSTWNIALSKDEAPEETGMVPWLVGIACLVARGILRRRTMRSLEHEVAAGIEDEDEPVPDSVLVAHETEQSVREAFATLDPRDRALLEAVYLSDRPRPYAEIAACLGIAVGSITMLRRRALRRLGGALRPRRAV